MLKMKKTLSTKLFFKLVRNFESKRGLKTKIHFLPKTISTTYTNHFNKIFSTKKKFYSQTIKTQNQSEKAKKEKSDQNEEKEKSDQNEEKEKSKQEEEEEEVVRVKSSSYKHRLVGYGVIVGALGFFIFKLIQNYDNLENPVSYVQKKMQEFRETFFEPSQKQLLPDILPELNELAKPVLVINLEDLLVHRGYDSIEGWRTWKRPGLDLFFREMSELYEIVIFCDSSMMGGQEIIQKLQPRNISHVLFRDSSLYKGGKVIKDLSKLNRDLAKIVLVEHQKDAYSLQPENAIKLEPWDGKLDTLLIDLVPLLKYLHTSEDVRKDILKLGKENGNATAKELMDNLLAMEEKKIGKNTSNEGWWSYVEKLV